MYTLAVREISAQTVLSGKELGKAFLSKLISALPPKIDSRLIAVDLAAVEVVTASFFREALRTFRDYARQILDCSVVFVNAAQATIDEAEILALQIGDVFVFANVVNGELLDGKLVGHLEDKQALTLKIVTNLGEADARRVQEMSGHNTGQTVWNNRLAALLAKGILVQRVEGRAKLYRPIIKEIVFG